MIVCFKQGIRTHEGISWYLDDVIDIETDNANCVRITTKTCLITVSKELILAISEKVL